MKQFYFLLFIFFPMCTAKVVGVPDPGSNDLWIQLLIRDKIEEIMDNEDLFDTITYSDSNNIILKKTLLLGAPNAHTSGKNLIVGARSSIYITGETTGGVYNAASVGIRDLIFGRYDSQMNPIGNSTRQIGNAGVSLEVQDIAVDSNGNTYITGNTNHHFRGAQLLGTTDMFLIKLDPDGNELWGIQKGFANSALSPVKIILDSLENVYITGRSTGPYGGTESGANGFIAKFNNVDGNEEWAKQIAFPQAQSFPTGLTFDKTTNMIYVTGITDADYKNNKKPAIGQNDIFIFKYDSQGNRQFFAQLGTISKSLDNASITVDLSGNVFVGGTSNGRFNQQFGGTSWLGTIAKYDSLGTLEWIQQFGPNSAPPKQAVIRSIITDIHGNVFTTGYTNGNILDGGDDSLGVQDAFITKHNSSGQVQWAEQIGTPGATISGNGLGLDSQGNLYVIGDTNRGINKTPIVGTQAMFLVKYK
ncbi:SBBP repeat-containing protein [Leptospira noguchii]|uniref:SBBP repeat beta-propeller lipoprotein, LipL53 family n=1 Tax=Leptospira noguchii TaxID=28182 RepID=UPI001FB811F1|nr:SBBP repeat-containing protein [Leptospira noguchii]UOG35372.1 SBBP repeat-containing protein [Leptospira noguchii]UOG46289.1 SBBP repeat-containing protein [Leptospira noguchii]